MDFFCWWYGSGLIFHTLHGIWQGSIAFKDIERKNLALIAVYVILDVTGTCTVFIAIRMMEPTIVSSLNQSQILFTLLMGFLILKEVLTKAELGAAGIIIAGMFVMTYDSGSAPFTGTVLVLFANFCGSIELIIIRKIGCFVGTYTFARIRTVSLFTVFLLYNLFSAGKVAVLPLPLLSAIIFGSFFGPFLNVIAIYKSLEYITAGKLALFRSIQPVFVMIGTGIFLRTYPGIRESIGGMIIIIGSMILAYFHIRYVLDWKNPLRSLR